MRIALLLIVAIITVVGLATLAAVSVIGEPEPEGGLQPVLRQVELLARVASENGERARAAGIDIRDQPAAGQQDAKLTRILGNTLRDRGAAPAAVVTSTPGRVGKTASVQLPDSHWLVVDFPDFSPPRDAWFVLAGWITLIVLGVTVVALYFTSVLTRPLEMLQAAVARIGPDGVLAPLPETGSGELRATARALNHLSARLKAAMEGRMRLVAAAGHDLRTPMTRLRLRAEFLPEEDREKWLNDLDELDRIADSAISLVREEVQSQDLSEPVALDRLLKEIVSELTALKLRARLVSADQACVRAGALNLRRALRNLIVNAATHGKGATVELQTSNGQAIVTISDDGPGIPPELLDKAFEPFFRVDPARRQSVPGAGLGLAIAKEIIDRYGGTITLANRPGGGLVQKIAFNRA
ncbi:ATP-binding protein [Pseudaminobacter soli (ex Li et al. 2025)]